MEYNIAYFLDVSFGDKALMRELIQIFEEQIPVFVSGIKKANAEGDYKQIAAIAHKAKSSVAVFGMTAWEEKLKQLQVDIINNQIPQNIEELVQQFEKDAYETLNYFKNYVNQLE
ncbi:MAG: Hpt domain-containing protein [Bacteroidales bacterium]|nr:Hpt domain-containing protein [Bacteroidales bacterium]